MPPTTPLFERLRHYIRYTSTGKLLLIIFAIGILPVLIARLFVGGNTAWVMLAVAWMCFTWGWAGLLIFKRRTSPGFVTPAGLLVVIVAIMCTVLCWGMTVYTLVLGLWQTFTP